MSDTQALRALADLIISYANRDDIPQVDIAGHLRCAETLLKAQRGEMTYLEAADAMDAKFAAKVDSEERSQPAAASIDKN